MKKTPALALFLFGAPRLERAGKPIEMDTRKALALLAYLAITRQSHSRDALAALLYPEYDQTHARAALRRTLATLNAALGEGQMEIDRENIGLNLQADLSVDVDQFRRALDEGKTHNHSGSDVCADCIASLTRAAEVYRDDFLAGFTLRDSPNFDDWQFLTAENLRREFAGVLEKLVRQLSAQQAYAPAIAFALRWRALDPLHEPAHRHLMQLYARSGQRAAALRQYQECVRVLEKELGVEPLEETVRLFEEIKENKLALNSGVWAASHQTELATDHSTPTPEPYPLVGRSAELEKIKQAYANIRADGHLIVIEGEAGIGKTRLAEEFLAPARERGAVTLAARAYEGETNLAYGIFVELLRPLIERADLRAKIPAAWRGQVARLIPEIGMDQPMPPLDSPSARGRFFEGISQTLLAIARGKTPGLLFFDDLQWADNASIDLLTYIVQRLRGRPLCLLATWRTENSKSIERLRQIAAQAERAGSVTSLALSRLPSSAVMQLVAAVSGDATTLTKQIGERLYRETEGLPFFVVEYLNALDKGAAVAKPADWSLPGGARHLLHARLAVASETGKQLLSAAAVIGRAFDFDTLHEASGRAEEEIIKTLEDLTAQGLVKEITATAGEENLLYDFAHEKLRALAYEETSAARRRLLHRRVAAALIDRGRARRETGALANQIARHYESAGQTAAAAEYFKLAGDHARALYANADALAHYRAALAFGQPDTTALNEAIGDAQTLLGDYAGALTSYALAATLCEPLQLACLEHKRGSVHHRRGEWALAESHFQLALNALVAHAPAAERAQLLADWSLTAHALGENERAQAMASRALELAEGVRDLPALAQAHNILGILARKRGDWESARYQLEQSCAAAEHSADLSVRIAALNNLALVCRDTGETARAIELTETSLALCASMGDRHREAALRNNLADLFHTLGKSAEAMVHLKQAVVLFAEIGADAEPIQPEIWKLVEW